MAADRLEVTDTSSQFHGGTTRLRHSIAPLGRPEPAQPNSTPSGSTSILPASRTSWSPGDSHGRTMAGRNRLNGRSDVSASTSATANGKWPCPAGARQHGPSQGTWRMRSAEISPTCRRTVYDAVHRCHLRRSHVLGDNSRMPFRVLSSDLWCRRVPADHDGVWGTQRDQRRR